VVTRGQNSAAMREDVGEPGFRVDVVEPGRHEEGRHYCGPSAPRSEPANNHAFLPGAVAEVETASRGFSPAK
jgi:hypothetical protein